MPSSKQGVRSNVRMGETGPQPSGLAQRARDDAIGSEDVENEHAEHANDGDKLYARDRKSVV